MHKVLRLFHSMTIFTFVGLLLFTVGAAAGAQSHGSGLIQPNTPATVIAKGLFYQWHTFYNVPSPDYFTINGSAVDSENNVYLVGTATKSFGTPLHAYSGETDIVVMKLDSLGKYVWHTFYGASPTSSENGGDEGLAITVDQNNNVYVTGYSDRTWAGPEGQEPIAAFATGSQDMFALKLNGSGAYQWHTFFQYGRAYGITTDNDAVYVTGYAGSSWGSPLHPFTGQIAVVKLNSSGAYQWHTYYGAMASSADETGKSIAVDPVHHMLYVTGPSPKSWNGDGNSPPLHDFSGGEGYSDDVAVLKLSTDGAYQWHTFYGASGYDDYPYGVAMDGAGNAYVTGTSTETWGTPLHPHPGGSSILVLKLAPTGSLLWNTFYGSAGDDSVGGIAVDTDGNSYISGSTAAWNGDGDVAPAHSHTENSRDIAVLKLNSNGAYVSHTFYGADMAVDEPNSIALGNNHALYITGNSMANWLGPNGQTPINAFAEDPGGDNFILKLSDDIKLAFLPVIDTK